MLREVFMVNTNAQILDWVFHFKISVDLSALLDMDQDAQHLTRLQAPIQQSTYSHQHTADFRITAHVLNIRHARKCFPGRARQTNRVQAIKFEAVYVQHTAYLTMLIC